MTKRNIILLVLAAIVLAIALVIGLKTGVMTFTKEAKVRPIADPLDVTLDFYGEWLAFARSTTTSPYDTDLINNPLFTNEAREALKSARGGALDPFFCQANTPERVGGKVLFELNDKAEIIILDRTPSSTSPFSQAIVSLSKDETAWSITKISCSNGEVAPESEFSFEQEGYLLKSMQAPYVNGQWHLVFEQNGTMGYVAPLLFNASSTCVASDGSSNICDTNSFAEMQVVKVIGNMLEEGAQVVRLESK